MLAMARRASVDSSCYSTFLAEEFRTPRRIETPPVEVLENEFVDALERVICGQPPVRTEALDTGGEHRPNLDELAALVIQALDTRNIAVKVAGNTARFVLEMPLASWETVNRLFIAMGGTGPIRATLGPELAKGSDTLVAGLQLLGVVDVDVDAPVDTAEMRLDAVCAPNSGQGPWSPKITVTRTAAGSTLKDIYVNVGAEVVGRGFAGLGVTVHYTDDQGNELRSEPLQQAPVEPPWKQTLFLALSASLRGLVLDLSGWTGDRAAEATEALKLQPDDWAQWKAIAGVDLDLILVSPELKALAPKLSGVNQLCTSDIGGDYCESDLEPAATALPKDPVQRAHLSRHEFIAEMALEPCAFDANLWFDALLGRIEMHTPKVLDLSTDVCDEVAAEFQKVKPPAWEAFMRHPEAEVLQYYLMSQALLRGGLVPIKGLIPLLG